MGASDIFIFNKCCFCVDLKTGCFIIGYLSLVGYTIAAIGLIVALAVGSFFLGNGDKIITNSGFKMGGIRVPSSSNTHELGLTVVIASAILLIFVAFLVAFVIALLVGLHKNKPGHVKAYLIYSSVFLLILAIHIFTVACSGNTRQLGQYIPAFIVNLYYVLVIRSQYLVMKNPDAAEGPAIYTS